MALFFKGIWTILLKAQVGAFLASLGLLAAGVGVLAGAIKYVLPSAPVLMTIFAIMAGIIIMAWYAVDQLKARQAKRDIEVAHAQTQAHKAKANG